MHHIYTTQLNSRFKILKEKNNKQQHLKSIEDGVFVMELAPIRFNVRQIADIDANEIRIYRVVWHRHSFMKKKLLFRTC